MLRTSSTLFIGWFYVMQAYWCWMNGLCMPIKHCHTAFNCNTWLSSSSHNNVQLIRERPSTVSRRTGNAARSTKTNILWTTELDSSSATKASTGHTQTIPSPSGVKSWRRLSCQRRATHCWWWIRELHCLCGHVTPLLSIPHTHNNCLKAHALCGSLSW